MDGNCQIQVTFTPSKSGNRVGSLTVVYPGVGSPLTTSLSGSGIIFPKVTLTPSKLVFGKQLLNSTSSPQTATLTNVGEVDVDVTNISTTGTFGQKNNCPGGLAPGQHCLIHVTFSPMDIGRSTGYLTVDDSAPDSPQTVSLSGVGTSVGFSPIGVNFGDQPVGTSSNPQTITFTNQGKVVLNISSVTIGGSDPGDFSQTNNCPSSLPAGGNCTIQVTFTPTQKGSRQGYLQVNDDAQPSPQQADLGGTGT